MASAKAFVARAAALRPRLLILLMPGSVELPEGYVLFDKHAHLFERAGEAERSRGGPLTFFLLQRGDTTERYKVRTETGKLMECWNPDPRHECWLPEGAQMAGPDDDDGGGGGGGGGGAAAGLAVEENEYDALAREAAALPPSFGAVGDLSYHNLAPGGAAEEGGASGGASASAGGEAEAEATARRDEVHHPPPPPPPPPFMSMPRSPQLNK